MLEVLIKKDIARKLPPEKVQFVPMRDGPTFEADFGPHTGWELVDLKTKSRFEQPMRWAQKCKETLDKRFEGKGISVKSFIFYRGKSLKKYEEELIEQQKKPGQSSEEHSRLQSSKRPETAQSDVDLRRKRRSEPTGQIKAKTLREEVGGSSRKRSLGDPTTSKTKAAVSDVEESTPKNRKRSLDHCRTPKSRPDPKPAVSIVRSEPTRPRVKIEPESSPGPLRTPRSTPKAPIGKIPPSTVGRSRDHPPPAPSSRSRGEARPPSSQRRSEQRRPQSIKPTGIALPPDAAACTEPRPPSRKRERPPGHGGPGGERRPAGSTPAARPSPSPPLERKKMRPASDAAAGDLNQVVHRPCGGQPPHPALRRHLSFASAYAG